MGNFIGWFFRLFPGVSVIPLILLLLIVPALLLQLWTADRALQRATGQLDAAQTVRDQCVVSRSSLELQVQDQNQALQDLRAVADARQAHAQYLTAQAQETAHQEYKAAQKLMTNRIGGEDCTAANLIINEVLGL